MKRILHVLTRCLASASSGVLLAGCFPGFKIDELLIWVWVIPFLLVLWTLPKSKRVWLKGALYGLCVGATFWLINIKWMIAMSELPFVPPLGGHLGWFLMATYLSLYFAVWGMLVASLMNPWKVLTKVEIIQNKSVIEQKIAKKVAESKKKSTGKWKISIITSAKVLTFASAQAALWVLLEWVRSWMFTGFEWNTVGVAFANQIVMAQAVDIVGHIGLSFFPIFTASVLIQTCCRFYKEALAGKFQVHLEIGFCVGILTLLFSYGVNRMAHFRKASTRDVKVLLVQQNIAQGIQWTEENKVRHYRNYSDDIQAAIKKLEAQNKKNVQKIVERGEGKFVIEYPELILLPESSFTTPLLKPKGQKGLQILGLNYSFFTQDCVLDTDCHIAFGSVLINVNKRDGGWRTDYKSEMYNTLAIAYNGVQQLKFGEETNEIQVHAKNHLVPFGEYVPDISLIREIYKKASGLEVNSAFKSGGTFTPIRVKFREGDVEVIPTICFEDTVSRLVRKFSQKGTQMIVNITNDGWFGKSEASEQHFLNARLRAVELRRPLVRAANTGVSAIVNVVGDIVVDIRDKSDSPFLRGSVYGKTPVLKQAPETIYSKFGQWFIGGCAILLVLFFIVQRMIIQKVND